MSVCVVVFVWADPDAAVQILHHTPVEKYGVSVVRNQVCGRHFQLALFEWELDQYVRQEMILLLMQTRREQDKENVNLLLLYHLLLLQ